jgi:hypothetical protein
MTALQVTVLYTALFLFTGAAGRIAAQNPIQNPSTAPRAAASTPSGLRVARAVRRTGPIILDGRLDEPDWRRAPATSGFTQSYPDPARPATDSTDVRVLYDDEALYVGVRMYDAHPELIAS